MIKYLFLSYYVMIKFKCKTISHNMTKGRNKLVLYS